MSAIEQLNIEPVNCAPRQGRAVAESMADDLLTTYMHAYGITIRHVADAYGLPFYAVRDAINSQIGSEQHAILFRRLELLHRAPPDNHYYDRDDVPLCGAKTRSGRPCQAKGFGRNGRCRNHGGMSTGPRTQRGRKRIAASNRRRARP